jgi:hypothetical protein
MKLVLAVAFVVGCGGGARPSQTAMATPAPAPASAPAAAPAPAPPPAPAANVVTPTLQTCVGTVEEHSSPCALERPRHPRWHLHGYVEKGGQCFECWDEESNDCETNVVGSSGYTYLGSSCGKLPPARR